MDLIADIRRAMREKGVSQSELARRLGMSPSQLSALLRDPDYNFTVKMLRRFAAALEVELTVRIGQSVPNVSNLKSIISTKDIISLHAHAIDRMG